MRRLVFVLLLFSFQIVTAQEVIIDDFSGYAVGEFPANEESGERWGIVSANPFHTDQYKVRDDDGNQYVEAIADANTKQNSEELHDVKVVRIVKPHRFEYKDGTPFLRWKWRVHTFPTGSQENIQYLNDSGASVLVTFVTPSKAYPTIKYIWSRSVEAGEVFKNPSFNEDFPTYFKVIRLGEGPKDANGPQWVHEEVNVFEDFKKIFGDKYSDYLPIIGVAVLSDANNTQSRAHADYDDFVRSSHPMK